MKKKKSGSIAIPFLLTFLIALIIIGGIAMIIYDKIDSNNSSLITMTNEAGTLSDSDSHTIMFVLDMSDSIDSDSDTYDDTDYELTNDDDESYSDDEEYTEEETYEWEEDGEDEENEEAHLKPYTFIIMRSVPVHKQIVLIGLPDNMLAGEKNKMLSDIYESGGGAEVKAAAEYSLDITIDRYMEFNSESFNKFCNVMGGVNFAVPAKIEGLQKSDSLQYLGADQIEKIISFGGYGGGEIQRTSTAVSIVSAMINQANGSRIADNLDNIFETMVNANDTDISALDYQQKKYAIKFMLKYSDSDNDSVSNRSKFITPLGKQTDEGFILDTSFTDEISQYFVVEATDSTVRQDTTLQPMLPETGSATDAQ